LRIGHPRAVLHELVEAFAEHPEWLA